jgi:hypothetical protein
VFGDALIDFIITKLGCSLAKKTSNTSEQGEYGLGVNGRIKIVFPISRISWSEYSLIKF